MKVKELIKWLRKQDQEGRVGIIDAGQDSGDWEELRENKNEWERHDLYPNFVIMKGIKRTKEDLNK